MRNTKRDLQTSPKASKNAREPMGHLAHSLHGLHRIAGNQAFLRALNPSQFQDPEAEADRIGESVATAIAPAAHMENGVRNSNSGARLSPGLLGRLESLLGWDLNDVRVYTGDVAASRAQTLGARAFTEGGDLYFNRGNFRPDTQPGLGLLGHELAHAHQQSTGKARWGSVQKKEDWDFTPADYKALKKNKQDLSFGADSAWFPKALQDNLLTTVKFALESKTPARTAGVNVSDFYHGHFAVPDKKVPSDLKTKRSAFDKKSEDIRGKALGGNWFDPVTAENLGAFTKAMQEVEKLATPMLEDALKIEGAAVFYHTYEMKGPQMNPGSPIRNIRTPIGGTPAGYDPSGQEKSANQFRDDYTEVLQFAFLVDETGVIHVTVGTTSNLSRVTGTPMS